MFTKKKVKKSKKSDFQSSLYIKRTNYLSPSFINKDKKRRNRSFDFDGSFKKKIIKKIRNKFEQKSNNKLTTFKTKYTVTDDETDINENYYGFSFFPNGNDKSIATPESISRSRKEIEKPLSNIFLQ